jgi:hypothetical protein
LRSNNFYFLLFQSYNARMPKHGVIGCEDCGKLFESDLPDNKDIGSKYLSTHNEIDATLVAELQLHHEKTGVPTNTGPGFGHDDFDVLLEDGNIGKIEANSHIVVYQELGKER